MSQANSVAPAALFATGEWRVTSDSTFVEHLTTIATDDKSEGKDNELTFRLEADDNILEVSYTMPSDTKRLREVWIRVQKGNAIEVAQKYFQGHNKQKQNTIKSF